MRVVQSLSPHLGRARATSSRRGAEVVQREQERWMEAGKIEKEGREGVPAVHAHWATTTVPISFSLSTRTMGGVRGNPGVHLQPLDREETEEID